MPVSARRLVRKMRGGAQAHLIQADDDRYYVVKFRNNPQHRRILINEWVAGTFLQHLGLTAPQIDLVRIDQPFLAANPEVYLQLGSRRIEIEPGWHFGSRFPGDPNSVTAYDFVPDALLPKVENMAEFAGILVFDKWTGNADARQCVFIRARLRDYVPSTKSHPLRIGFMALMIDHGYIFNGPHWEYTDSPQMGIYLRPTVYHRIRDWRDFEPWLERVRSFPEEVMDDACRRLPPEWFDGDTDAFYTLLERLLDRRRRIPDLILDCARSRLNPFPQWNPVTAG